MINRAKLLEKALKSQWELGGWTGRRQKPFEIKPEKFLSFAKSDLKQKLKRGSINALSNVKRAIDCQLDSLLIVLGFYKKAKKENWNFPYKLEFLNKIGIIAPSILRKINKQRNLLEHEYRFPKKEEVEDAIDITDLFLTATNKFIDIDIGTVEIELRGKIFKKGKSMIYHSKGIDIDYEPNQRIFKITYKDSFKKERLEIIISELDPNFNQLFLKFIKVLK